MIKIEGVRKSFGALEVLKGIDLTVERGEVLCLIGGSGSGKSTLLMCINALEGIDAGRVEVDGIDVHAPQTEKNKLRQKMGIVFQQFNAFPHLTARDNVALAPRRVLGQNKVETLELAEHHLAHVGLGDKLDHFPSELSGGQQQRLAIARALAMKPDYMLLDEVTSALDPELVGEVLDTLRLLAEEGITMIAVTHEIPFAREVADRVAFFHQGVIHEVGPAKSLISNPQMERTQEFLGKIL
ncbi:amino acid ABC transporter ATP-binding protein [Octadecabacter ascidiaceicola]|uniref:Glutamine transport ATP-binding protein GlnQ n=1 Tax=Octadecabacter ascidiaceicola TaxID=1655543 RepID=A0A238K2K6_9RHOB|nr:amino acid ABC transporter ATP-binding protein [Octadecabacter ascidiaceicola]SMX37141.1 Glutamine transport ATP-binding protein GlnQ [Octadecabacter ascidiaceicola]